MTKYTDKASLHELITYYYEKHHALKQGDMKKLREIKNKCPEIFDATKDKEISELIKYAKKFQTSEQYKKNCQEKCRAKLTIVKDS